MSEGRSPERLCEAAACGRDLMAKPWSDVLVQRTVAALGEGQAAALGGDRTALHAVRGGDVDVDGLRPGLELLVRDLVDLRRAHRDPGLGELAGHSLLDPDVVGSGVARRVS